MQSSPQFTKLCWDRTASRHLLIYELEIIHLQFKIQVVFQASMLNILYTCIYCNCKYLNQLFLTVLYFSGDIFLKLCMFLMELCLCLILIVTHVSTEVKHGPEQRSPPQVCILHTQIHTSSWEKKRAACV